MKTQNQSSASLLSSTLSAFRCHSRSSSRFSSAPIRCSRGSRRSSWASTTRRRSSSRDDSCRTTQALSCRRPRRLCVCCVSLATHSHVTDVLLVLLRRCCFQLFPRVSSWGQRFHRRGGKSGQVLNVFDHKRPDAQLKHKHVPQMLERK